MKVVPRHRVDAPQRTVSLVLISITLVLITVSFGLARPQPPGSDARSAVLYREACSACHGAGGSGSPPSQVAFSTPLPDFTDCNFATREPNVDWIAVVHDGGPARGFSRMMPAFGEALSMHEIHLVVAHLREFCPDEDWPRGELNLPRPLVTEKAFPEDEAVYTFGMAPEGDAIISGEVVYEQRFGARNQFEVMVPFGWRERLPSQPGDGDWTGSVGDVAVGAKRALYHSIDRGSIFSLAGEFILPTGDSRRGFGKGTTVFEPFASFGQILPSDFFLHAQGGLEFPFDTDKAGREGFWRFALGRSFTQGKFGRVWSPMVELLAARELESGAETSYDLVPQLHVTLNQRQHIMLNCGVRLPLTNSDERSAEFLVFLLWDWFDGGFLEGW